MSTLATKSPGPANTPDRRKPAASANPPASANAPDSAEPSGSARAPASTESLSSPKPSSSEELAGSLVVGRPPSQLLAPSPDPEEGIPRSFPHTTPERPWDRLSVAARKPAETAWDEERPRLDAELPPDAPKGTSLIGSIVILVVEVLLGHRPATALRHWLTPEVYGPVARRAGLAIRIKGRAPWTCRPRILKVLANKPLARVIEAAAAVYDGQRVRAACLRMEFLRGRWKVVALEIA